MSKEHTPAPWIIGRGYSNTNATPIRWKGENLAWVCGLDSAHRFTKEQTLANAQLIAAAPELLTALKDCAAWLESNRPLEANKKSDAARNALNAARAVLAKVKGGQA